jgi:hypothetical protein
VEQKATTANMRNFNLLSAIEKRPKVLGTAFKKITGKNAPKRRNFAQSGHTVYRTWNSP